MTPQAKRLLKDLVKIQPHEGEELLLLDSEERPAFRNSETGREYKLRYPLQKTRSILEELKAEGIVAERFPGCWHVLHKGWHQGYLNHIARRNFLIRSVFVPIFVSFVTAVLTTLAAPWLTGIIRSAVSLLWKR